MCLSIVKNTEQGVSLPGQQNLSQLLTSDQGLQQTHYDK